MPAQEIYHIIIFKKIQRHEEDGARLVVRLTCTVAKDDDDNEIFVKVLIRGRYEKSFLCSIGWSENEYFWKFGVRNRKKNINKNNFSFS